MNPRPIALVDSGIGGLSVASAIARKLPEEHIIYLGDTARVPYGSRSKKLIESFALELVKFLIGRNPKVLVVACNTIAALAIEKIKDFLQGKVPVIDVIEPVVGEIQKIHQKGVVAVIGTEATIRSDIYPQKLAPIPVIQKACPLLVNLIEEGFTGGPIAQLAVEYYLKEFQKKSDIAELILGCTHYPLIKGLIKKAFGSGVQVVDSAGPTAVFLENYLAKHRLESPSTRRRAFESSQRRERPKLEDQFYFTDISPALKRQFRLFRKGFPQNLNQISIS